MKTQMTINPKYSFVMPAYKGRFIREAISSILCQSYENFELIVVDDASPDDIEQIVSEFQDSRIRYYKNSVNIGFENLVKQWNYAIQYAYGDWIILATDDDVYEPDFLQIANEQLMKYKHLDIFRARLCVCDAVGEIYYVEPCLPELTSFEEYLYMMYFGLNGGVPQYVFRKSRLNEIGGFVNFPKAWGSDDYTAILMSLKGITCSSRVLVKFRNSGLNISSKHKYVEEKLLASLIYFKKIYYSVLPLMNSNDIQSKFFTNQLQGQFIGMVRHIILSYFCQINYFQRYKYFRWIWHYMPYLDSKRKLIMVIHILKKW